MANLTSETTSALARKATELADDAIPPARPDRYFSAEQIERLQFLMQRSQEAAEKTGPPLTPQEEAERNALIGAELRASAQRADALADALGR